MLVQILAFVAAKENEGGCIESTAHHAVSLEIITVLIKGCP